MKTYIVTVKLFGRTYRAKVNAFNEKGAEEIVKANILKKMEIKVIEDRLKDIFGKDFGDIFNIFK